MKAALELLAPDLVADLKARRYCRPSISVFHPTVSPILGWASLISATSRFWAGQALPFPICTPVVFAAPGGDAYTLNYRSVETISDTKSDTRPDTQAAPKNPNTPSNAGTRTQWLEATIQQGKLPPALRRHAERGALSSGTPGRTIRGPRSSFPKNQTSRRPPRLSGILSRKLPPRLNRKRALGPGERGAKPPESQPRNHRR